MILGVIEHDRGTLSDLSLQMLTLGRQLAQQTGTPLHALLISEAARPLAETLAAHGATTVHLAADARLDEFVPEAWARCVIDRIGAHMPEVVLAAGTARGHELLAHVAARADLPLATNCTAVQPGDPFAVTRVRWGGSLLEEATLSGATKLLTVAAHAFAAAEAPAPVEPHIETFAPVVDEADFRVRVTGRVEPESGKISLASARVVVGGGRGVGSAEGFAALEELAGLLGGAVGCSRVVTSLGWRPHADQVGQTGTRIAPDVYIACGISGAIQHMVGCMNAKCLVAINSDDEAPMVAEADYAIIGDLQEVVPAISEAIRAARRTS